jgi:hypothetical protein
MYLLIDHARVPLAYPLMFENGGTSTGKIIRVITHYDEREALRRMVLVRQLL